MFNSESFIFKLKPLLLNVAENAVVFIWRWSLAGIMSVQMLQFCTKTSFAYVRFFTVVRYLWCPCIFVNGLLVLCPAFTAEQYQQHQQQLALMQQQQLAQTQQQQANSNSATATPQVRARVSHGNPSLLPARVHL